MRRSAFIAVLFMGSITGPHAENLQRFDQIERGRYIAVLGDCAGCHTESGAKPFAGGLSLETPFGRLVAPNITPDLDTGIGNWSDQEFISAVRDGRGHNGTRLYPAMPYPTYTRMSDEDVWALRAYFATIEPVRHEVIANQLPFPFNIRASLIVWDWVNFRPGRFEPDRNKSEEWNRGAYLVKGPGHCGTCHTPKNLLGGDKNDRFLAGTALQGWFAPNITKDEHIGIGRWSRDELVQYLRTGVNAWTLASGPMAEAVSHSTSQMTDADLQAIATFLKDNGEAHTGQDKQSHDKAVMAAGEAIYKDNCAACHRDNGQGEATLFPRLAGSALAQQDDGTTLIRLVLQGSLAVATSGAPTGPAMPPFDWRLNDGQVATVLNYIRNSWGNFAANIDPSTVRKSRNALAKAR
jgi:mono/diheme cytochrome c family protein